MKGIEVQIDAEAINKQVSEAILDSALGKQLESAIDVLFRDYEFTTVLNKAVERELDRILSIKVREAFELPAVQKQVASVVLAKLTDKVMIELAGRAIDYMLRNRD
jgi:hypothetical protein